MNAKESELSIMIERSDGGKIDEKLAAEIRSKLSKQIEDAVRNLTSSRKLEFERNKLASEGFFVVKALTKDSRDWLLSCNLGSVRGIPLSVKLLNRAEVLVQLPNQGKTIPEDPMHLIIRQNDHNKDLRMSEWNLINRQTGPKGENLIIGVPKEVTNKFPEKLDLTFLGTQVEAKVVKSTTLIEKTENANDEDESEESDKNEETDQPKKLDKLKDLENPHELDTSKESEKLKKTENANTTQKKNELDNSNVSKNAEERKKNQDEGMLGILDKTEVTKESANESDIAAKQEKEKSTKANSDSDKETKGKKNTSCLGAILKKVRSRKKNNEEDIVIVQTASNHENLKK